MNKKFLLVALFAAWCLEFVTSVAFAQIEEPKTKVAIYTTGDVDASYKKVIGSKVTSVITQSSKYAAVERTADFLNALSQEHDYQRSGAVSDNQIVKIGQQFGVRYVVVLDISDLFGSLFISARMIDVRTGVIASSAEIGGEIQSMTKLIEISTLLGEAIVGVENYKVIGPYATKMQLVQHCKDIPQGYHVASKEDVEKMVQVASMTGAMLQFPIYCGLKISRQDKKHYYSGFLFYKDKTCKSIVNDYWYVGINNMDSVPVGYIYLVKD
ncbi:MAG: hypothetical protein IKU78_02845 [Paludibacteraceae bacterium]|nr:hypothetical protein [Paludibacteraceae bacterium]